MSQNSFLNAFLNKNLRGKTKQPAVESAQDPGTDFDNLLKQYSRQWVALGEFSNDLLSFTAAIFDHNAWRAGR
jgi:hypothetical protein